MTSEEIEAFLQAEKKSGEEALGVSLCERYARCAYCEHGELPCATARMRYLEALRGGAEPAASWLLPEPNIMERAYPRPEQWEVPEEEPEPAAEASAESSEVPAEAAAESSEVPAEAAAESSEAAAEAVAIPAPHVIRRGKRGGVRLALFKRKQK